MQYLARQHEFCFSSNLPDFKIFFNLFWQLYSLTDNYSKMDNCGICIYPTDG